jgi:hypothetical protein
MYFNHIHPPLTILVPYLFPNSLPPTFMYFFLNLDSTYEGKHAIVVFLSPTYFI